MLPTRGAVDVVGGVDALAGRKVVIGELARIQIAEILRGRPRAADDDGKNQRDSKHAIGCMAVSEQDGSYDEGGRVGGQAGLCRPGSSTATHSGHAREPHQADSILSVRSTLSRTLSSGEGCLWRARRSRDPRTTIGKVVSRTSADFTIRLSVQALRRTAGCLMAGIIVHSFIHSGLDLIMRVTLRPAS